MEESELTDALNDMMQGGGGVSPTGYPIALMIGLTSNVCSMSLDIFCPEDNVEDLRSRLEGKPSSPSWSGLSQAR